MANRLSDDITDGRRGAFVATLERERHEEFVELAAKLKKDNACSIISTLWKNCPEERIGEMVAIDNVFAVIDELGLDPGWEL